MNQQVLFLLFSIASMNAMEMTIEKEHKAIAELRQVYVTLKNELMKKEEVLQQKNEIILMAQEDLLAQKIKKRAEIDELEKKHKHFVAFSVNQDLNLIADFEEKIAEEKSKISKFGQEFELYKSNLIQMHIDEELKLKQEIQDIKKQSQINEENLKKDFEKQIQKIEDQQQKEFKNLLEKLKTDLKDDIKEEFQKDSLEGKKQENSHHLVYTAEVVAQILKKYEDQDLRGIQSSFYVEKLVNTLSNFLFITQNHFSHVPMTKKNERISDLKEIESEFKLFRMGIVDGIKSHLQKQTTFSLFTPARDMIAIFFANEVTNILIEKNFPLLKKLSKGQLGQILTYSLCVLMTELNHQLFSSSLNKSFFIDLNSENLQKSAIVRVLTGSNTLVHGAQRFFNNYIPRNTITGMATNTITLAMQLGILPIAVVSDCSILTANALELSFNIVGANINQGFRILGLARSAGIEDEND